MWEIEREETALNDIFAKVRNHQVKELNFK
jgi:hypothetical protein